uniref:Uncharacterized protein TCIL3000_11_11020 n=1 Tax=Trypanosoma congolense (strain IL3000) TaxID=1068625 RepID=G0V1U8_TRYCI|nr:unnamed protein product [Trypanosoma congolense IL3000]
MFAGDGSLQTVAGDAAAGRSNCFTMHHFASFTAMEVIVTIVPRFTMPRITTTFGGRYGPFTPNFPVDVPLWLALHIRKTDTCTIQPPPYVALPYLRQVVEREKESDTTFETLPFYFFEIVKKLCDTTTAAEDIPHVVEVVRLVEEIRAIRRRKLQQSMAVFEAEGSPLFIPGIKLTNIVNHELQYLRTSFAIVLQQSADMKKRKEQVVGRAIDNAVVPMRSSGTAFSYTPPSTAAESEAHLSDYATLRSGDLLETPSTATVTERPTFTPEGVPAPDTTASFSEPSDPATMGSTTDTSAPPLRKRRTLRQT